MVELMRMAKCIYPILPFLMLGVLFLTAWGLARFTGW